MCCYHTNLILGTTKVFHDLVKQTIKTVRCNEAYCFKQPIRYDIPILQIAQLIDISEECYQDIWFSCFSAKLTKYAAWKDRNGDIQEHFTNNDTNVCNCHQNQSCFSVMPNINYCNCDTGDIVQREDTMRITNKVISN